MEVKITEAGTNTKAAGVDKTITVLGRRGAAYLFHRNAEGKTWFVLGLGAKHGRCQPSAEVIAAAEAA